MPTYTSSLTAYADVDDLLIYRDWTQIADAVAIANSSGVASRPTLASLQSNDIVLTALKSASGEVEEYALKGKRYTVEDLQSLIGVNLERLKELVCHLAIARILGRKRMEVKEDSFPGLQEARSMLTKLGRGDAIFGIVETQEAGVGGLAEGIYDDIDPLTNTAYRFFGVRNSQQNPQNF